MKRWTIFAGRLGTILMAISLAMLLASLIPPAQTGNFGGTRMVQSKMFLPLSQFQPVLTPRQGIQVKITANGTFMFYLLEVESQVLSDWIGEHHPEPDEDFFSVTNLEDFLEANRASISWLEKEIHEGTIEYAPTKVTKATLIFSNPSGYQIIVDYEGVMISLIAPRKVRSLTLWTLPIGLVLALPWFTQLWKEKTSKEV